MKERGVVCGGLEDRKKSDHEMVIFLLNRRGMMASHLFEAVGKHRFWRNWNYRKLIWFWKFWNLCLEIISLISFSFGLFLFGIILVTHLFVTEFITEGSQSQLLAVHTHYTWVRSCMFWSMSHACQLTLERVTWNFLSSVFLFFLQFSVLISSPSAYFLFPHPVIVMYT